MLYGANVDQIRNKRLAKLGSQAPTQSFSANTGESSSRQSPSAASGAIPQNLDGSEGNNLRKTKTQVPQALDQSTSQNPFYQIGTKQATSDGPRINISPTRPKQTLPKQQRTVSSSSKSVIKAEESLEVWEDRTLRAIFRLTLDSDVTQDSFGHTLHYVASVHDDLKEQSESIMMAMPVLDQAILEAASNLGRATPLEYLLACWKRVMRQFKQLKSGKSEDPKYVIVKEARRLCMSYCIFAITMPEMFG